MRSIILLYTFLLLTSTSLFAQSRPDIVFILADDLGFSDIGCYGGEIRTPALDNLANSGIRFRQFYNASRCCPTRASLLTGQYAHRVGLKTNGKSLSKSGVTIAELLKASGYQTSMSGKWHLSFTPQLQDKNLHQQWIDHRHGNDLPFAPLDSYPVRRGFDRHFGIIWGVINYFDPFSLVDGTTTVKNVPENFYITDAITDHAVNAVQDFSKNEKPFFLYVAHCAPHWPLHALPEDIARYKNVYKEGWHALRENRHKQLKKIGAIGTQEIVKLQGIGNDWDLLNPQEKEIAQTKMAVHAAMVDRMDQGIGKIVAALKNAGRFDNTLIIFLSDNGASPESVGQPGYDRSSMTRGGKLMQYSGFKPADIGAQTTYSSIGSWWANAANTPWRYWKKESYEGGIHTPMIVHWPKVLKSNGGSWNDYPGHVIDLLPTCLDVAGLKYPANFNGNLLGDLDGQSLMPALLGKIKQRQAPLFFEHERGRAVRKGDWKLVASSLPNSKWELFNLSKDPFEKYDLAASEVTIRDELITLWNEWAKKIGAQTKMSP